MLQISLKSDDSPPVFVNLFPIRFVTVGKIHGGYVAITYNSYVEIFFRYLKNI